MLSKRVVCIAAERQLQKKLAAGLMAAGAVVESAAQLSELAASKLESDLVVYASSGRGDPGVPELLGRLKEDAKVVVVIPTSDLTYTVELLRDQRVHNVVVADDLQAVWISSIATRILYGDIFGVEKMMPWGVRIYSMLVGDYNEKSIAIAAISDFANAMGVRRKYRESIEQSVDELLMNALYDAPVDQAGKPVFANVPTKSRISLKLEQKALIQYACDGDTFAVAVRDPYGTLTKETVVKYLDKCLHAADQIDKKVGGAGLGFYIVANAASQVAINSYPGVATECVVTFDLNAPKVQLKNFGFYEERIDVAGRLATGESRERLIGPRSASVGTPSSIKVMLLASILLVVAALAVAIYPRLIAPKRGNLLVETKPPGATIYVDGKSRGVAPLRLTDLEAGRAYRVRAVLPGYQEKEDLVTVGANEETVVPFVLRIETGSVTIVSQPPGARVFVAGQDTGKLTPATLTGLPTGEQKLVTLRLEGYQDAHTPVVAPPRGESITHTVTMAIAPGYGTLVFESTPPGAEVALNGKKVDIPPNGLVLKGGTYELTARLPGHVLYQRTISVSSGQRTLIQAKLEPGGELTLRSNVVATLLVDGKQVGQVPLSIVLLPGKRMLTVRGYKPFLYYEFPVTLRVGEKIEKTLAFGTVTITAPGVVALPKGGPKNGVTELALPEGKHQLTLRRGTEEKVVEVEVGAGKTTTVNTF